MDDIIITSKQNEIVKFIRSLREKKNRDSLEVFVVEGVKSVMEAVSAGKLPQKLIVSEHGEKNETISQIINEVQDKSEIYRVSDQVFEYMSETKSPQGVLGVLNIPHNNLDSIKVDSDTFLLILDSVQDPGNFGTIIRTADAFGVKAVISTTGSADLYNGKTMRATMGSVFHLPVVREVEPESIVAFLEKNNLVTYAAHLHSDAVPLQNIKLKRPIALVLGNEGKGVSETFLKAADEMVMIPMGGSAESLNVAASSAIMLYEAYRQYVSDSIETCK